MLLQLVGEGGVVLFRHVCVEKRDVVGDGKGESSEQVML